MAIPLKQSTASQEVLLGPFLDDTDGKTAETGLTIANTDLKVWKGGGTSEASKNSGGATHIASGRYYATLDATDTDTLGPLVVSCHVAGALPVRLECWVLPANVYDSLFGSDKLETDVAQFGGTNLTSTGGRPEVNVSHLGGSAIDQSGGLINANVKQISGDATAADNLEAAADGTGYNLGSGQIVAASVTGAVGSVGAGGITAASIATGAIDADAVAADAVTEIQSGLATAAAVAALPSAASTGGGMITGRPVEHGSTDQSTVVRMFDATTTGYPATGVTSAWAGINLRYRREGGAVVSLTESDLAAADSAHDDGGMVHLGAGYYRVDLPDAAWEAGAEGVLVYGTGSGIIVVGAYHPLVPAASSGLDAAGVRDAVGLASANLDTQLSAIKSDTAATLADTGTDGVVVAAGSKSGYSLAADQSGVTVGTVNALGAQAKADVNAEVVDAIATDTYAEPTSVPAATSSLKDKIGYIFTRIRNKREQTSDTETIYQDDAATVLATASKSDDGTTLTKGEDTTA